jgi:hypothetical protein
MFMLSSHKPKSLEANFNHTLYRTPLLCLFFAVRKVSKVCAYKLQIHGNSKVYKPGFFIHSLTKKGTEEGRLLVCDAVWHLQ